MQMHRFDYSFLRDALVPAGVLSQTSAISELRVRQSDRLSRYESVFAALESVAKVESVKGSNAIEGIVTSDQRLEAIVNRASEPLNHDEAEIAGYRDALAVIHANAGTLDISETTIRELHRLIFSYTAVNGGEYKPRDNYVMDILPSGERRIRFTPVSAADTPRAMQQLVLAYWDAAADPAISPLLLIGCFIVDFLCIHPFLDGNGRMSRLLALLLLYRNGYDAGKYIALEQQVNDAKWLYYDALGEASLDWHDNAGDYFAFVKYFLSVLLASYRELDARFAVVNTKSVNKRGRIEATVLNSLTPVHKRDIARIVPDASITTIEAVLAQMVRQGVIIKTGAGPATAYIRP
jgi:Fic family protein